jgi:hypothetical protein
MYFKLLESKAALVRITRLLFKWYFPTNRGYYWILVKYFFLLGELISLRDLINPAVLVADKKLIAVESISYRSRSFILITP